MSLGVFGHFFKYSKGTDFRIMIFISVEKYGLKFFVSIYILCLSYLVSRLSTLLSQGFKLLLYNQKEWETWCPNGYSHSASLYPGEKNGYQQTNMVT